MSEHVLWNAIDWLRDNYNQNNGLPMFFLKGDYSYQSRNKAVDDYIATVRLAKTSNVPAFSEWANAVVEEEFSVLSNRTVGEFWNALLYDENRQQSLSTYQTLKFINSDASSSQYNPTTKGTKRRNSSSSPSQTVAPPQTRRQRIPINEVDGIFITGLETSLGTTINTQACNTEIIDRKSRYFISLGMNGILDLTDNTPGSQLAQLPEETVEALKTKFPTSHATVKKDELNSYDALLKRNEKNYRQFMIASIDNIRLSTVENKYDIIRDSYLHILKAHLYSPELFTESTRNSLSEQDYIVKLWGYIVETVFRSSNIMPHWGDTISPFCIKKGYSPKMDLRLLDMSDGNFDDDDSLDIGNAEFAKTEYESKFYKDLLKSVLSSKIQLNELLKDFRGMTQERLKGVRMPLCVVAGTTCYAYSLRLESRNFYVIEDLSTMSIPLSLKDIKTGGISDLLEKLLVLKSLCLDLKALNEEKQGLLNEAKRPVIAKNRRRQSGSTLKWCKEMWLPPPMDDDTGDGE